MVRDALKKMKILLENEDNVYGTDKFMGEFSKWLKKTINQQEHFYLYRYCKIDFYLLDSILKNNIYLSENGRLNDGFEGIPCLFVDNQEYEKEIVGRYGFIKSFSENESNMAMWSLYADEGKGVCIKYDLKYLPENSSVWDHIFPVLYRKERNGENGIDVEEIKDAINLFDAWRSGNLSKEEIDRNYFDDYKQLFLFKGMDWETEREWRLIYTLGDILDGYLPESRELDFECIVDICLGDRVDSVHESALKRVIRNKNITLKRARKKQYTFEYEFEKINIEEDN